MQIQNSTQNDFDLLLTDEDFSEAQKSPIHRLRISRFLSTETTYVEIYSSRITIIRKPFVAVWEHKETYHIMDMGDIIVNKGLFRSTLIVRRRNSKEDIFVLNDLRHEQASRMKEILNMMILKRQKFMLNMTPTISPPKIYSQVYDP